jgi:hypothetical protein
VQKNVSPTASLQACTRPPVLVSSPVSSTSTFQLDGQVDANSWMASAL